MDDRMHGTHLTVCPKLTVLNAELRSKHVQREEGMRRCGQVMQGLRRDLRKRFRKELFYDYEDVATCVTATYCRILAKAGFRGV
jgi:hypothetical protein